MRILHLYKEYFPVLGGIENHVRCLAEYQAAHGHEVTVLVAGQDRKTSQEDFNGVHVIRAARWATVASTPLSVAFFLQARQIRADVTHLHFPHPPGEIANYLFRPSPRTVLTYHSDIIRQKGILQFYRPLMHRILRRIDTIIVTSPAYLASSETAAKFQSHCEVIPLGIDADRFSYGPDRQDARTRITLPLHGPIALFVGLLRYYKGLDVMIRALSQLPDLHLAVVGEGPMLSQWKQLAQSMNVLPRITFAGEVSSEHLPVWYAAANLFVLPANARSEAFGTVLLEAMAAGLPVVSTELGTGTSWVNQNGTTGLVVPPNDPAALKVAIQTIISHPDLAHKMGSAGRERVHTCFRKDQMNQKVLECYETVFRRNKHQATSG